MKRKAEPDAEEMASSKGPSTSKKLAPEADHDFINETELQKSIQVSVLKVADGIIEELRKNGGQFSTAQSEVLKFVGVHFDPDVKRSDDVHFDPDVIAHVSALVWDTVSDDWTSDLLAFSSHARRETVNVSDVVMIMRKNQHLQEMVSKAAGVDLSDFARPLTRRQRSTNKESSRGRRSDKTRRGRPGEAQCISMGRNTSVKIESGGRTSSTSPVPTRAAKFETPSCNYAVQSKNSRDRTPSKSPSPDLFNASVNGGDSSDEFFEIADPQPSNVAPISETCNETTTDESSKTVKGGWSTKFSEFSFFDTVPSPTTAHDIEKGVSCGGSSPCPSSSKMHQETTVPKRSKPLLGKVKTEKTQPLPRTRKLMSYGEPSADEQNSSSTTSKTLPFRKEVTKRSEEKCPMHQPVSQDYTNSDEEFFDL